MNNWHPLGKSCVRNSCRQFHILRAASCIGGGTFRAVLTSPITVGLNDLCSSNFDVPLVEAFHVNISLNDV